MTTVVGVTLIVLAVLIVVAFYRWIISAPPE
jgi:hypothetical protein